MSVPLSFEPNQGQAASTVQFLSRGSGYAIFLSPGKVVLNLERQQPASPAATGQTPQAASVDTVRMSLIGANAKATAAGLARQPGVVNYFMGNDPKKWRSAIPTYGKVAYPEIYPGVELVFYGNQRQLEYDFVVAPGADPGPIAWRIDGARASIDAEGNLALRAPNGPATFQKPVLYQMEGDRKVNVEGSFAVAGNQIHFRVGSYDHSRALIIDPVLSYASYLAGTGTDTIGTATGPGSLQAGVSQALAVDSAGSAYVTGSTLSLDFPTKTPYQGAPPQKVPGVSPGAWSTAFVTKFSPDGSSLVYSTYLGGNGADHGYAIAVDSSGSAYVTGLTTSPNFPITSGAYQTVCSPIANNTGASSAVSNCNSFDYSTFVTKLNSTGTGLVYSTFLGGYAGWEYATAIAVDSAGRAYIAGNETAYCSTGYTFQACFPTTSGAVIGGDKTGGRSPQYAFVAAFNSTGSQLLYSTLFGDLNGLSCADGCGDAWATGVAVDASGYFYLVGETKAGKLPTTAGVVQPTGAPLDAKGVYVPAHRGFIAKFTPVTSAGGVTLAYATYLGGRTEGFSDYISGIAIDSASNAYVVGYTNSKDFPVTSGAYGTVCGPGGGTCAAAHVTKLNPFGTAILWSTYVGGSKSDSSDALFFTGPIQLDGKGNIYFLGQAGPAFPLFNPVEPPVSGGSMQLVVAELDSAGANLLFASRIGSGGLQTSYPAGLAVGSAGDIFLAGNTLGPGLITTPGAFQTTASASTCCYHGFVAKIAPTVLPTLQSGTLANGATYVAGGLVPGSWAQVKGTNLSTTTRIWAASDFTGLGSNLPTNLSGVQVKVNNQLAAVYYISPTQISFQVPAGIAGTATVQVISSGQTSNSVSAAAATNSPGIFPVTVNGTNYAAAIFLDGKFAADPSNGPAFRNAVPGDTVQLFATGLVPSPAGTTVSTTLLSGVTVTIGTVTIPASAAALVAVGEFQINFTVPQSFAALPPGLYPISISINGVTSPASIDSSPPGPVVIPIQH
ncbi:MAG: SBBP repeat-containing protein [Candidatus Solibacter sp.]|nr:SBBP repeat-containing protein [Candidatus Solibacter sp.]